MSEPEKRRSKRVPVAMRIKLRYRKLDSFISKFATNVSTEGMFISSRKPKEVGTELRFELRLADDSTVISGRGKVVWVRPFDKDKPKEPHGMGIRFIQLSKSSKETIETMVSERAKQGLGSEDGIPYAIQADEPADATPSAPPPPLGTPTSAPSPTDSSRAASKSKSPAPELAAVYRGDSGAPKPPVADSSGVPLTMEDIDTLPIDMSDAMQRARRLVSNGGGDATLEELSRVSAAPVAASVDEASNELAKILGGEAIKALRSQRDEGSEGSH